MFVSPKFSAFLSLQVGNLFFLRLTCFLGILPFVVAMIDCLAFLTLSGTFIFSLVSDWNCSTFESQVAALFFFTLSAPVTSSLCMSHVFFLSFCSVLTKEGGSFQSQHSGGSGEARTSSARSRGKEANLQITLHVFLQAQSKN